MTLNIFKILGYAGVFEILRHLKTGPKSFSYILTKTQFNPNIVNRNLKIMIQYKIVEKVPNGYVLTKIGLKALDFAIDYDREYFTVNYHALSKVLV